MCKSDSLSDMMPKISYLLVGHHEIKVGWMFERLYQVWSIGFSGELCEWERGQNWLDCQTDEHCIRVHCESSSKSNRKKESHVHGDM